MTALEQACAGLALVAGLAMLATRQRRATFIFFAVQAASVVAVAVIDRQPLLILPPAAALAAIWMVRLRTDTPTRADRVIPALAAGGVLALLCLSVGDAGMPLAVVLLPVVLAATRHDPVTRLLALGGTGNGLVLTGCLVAGDHLLPLAGLALPLPLLVSLLRRPHGLVESARRWGPRTRSGWAELAGAAALFAATVTVPLGALASVFAPLIAFDGVVRARVERTGEAVWPGGRLMSPLKLGFILLAICTTDPVVAWLGVVAAATISLLPAGPERGDRGLLASFGAGLALFGLLTLPSQPSLVGYLGLFGGYAMLAAAVPDLAIALLVLILRFADQTDWLPEAGPLGAGVTLIALLICSAVLIRRRRHRADVLVLAQCSVAALGIATLQPDGRFAAVVVLILLSLTRTACRATGEPCNMLAMAGLAGVPPIGVFPGLVLVVLAVASHAPWLLLPLGAALPPVMLAGLPRRLPAVSLRTGMLSLGWLPLALAALFGFFAPAELVRWLAGVTIGPS